jgi:integrase
MAYPELMTWSKTDRRWHKGYLGRRYAVSPKQLGCPATKEASRAAANEWWEKKRKAIDEALGKAKQHPAHIVQSYQHAIENHRLFAKWVRKYSPGDIEYAVKSEATIEWLNEALRTDDPPFPLTKAQHDPLWQEKRDEDQYGLWSGRLEQIKRDEQAETATPKENTIRAHIDDFLLTRKAQAEANGKIATNQSEQYHLTKFRQWVEPLAGIDALNETLWERYCLHLAQQVKEGAIAPATMRGTQIVVRAFIRNRWERRFIDLPRNLTSRNLSAAVPLQEIVVFAKSEIKQLLAKASDRKRLYILLALNCGLYPVDIAALRQGEVDWQAGRITRQRTKTKGNANVPKVDYLLWRKTFNLLKKCRANDDELVLLNTNGSPLWRYVEKDGKQCKVSNVATAFYQLLREVKIPHKPLSALRKTSASMLQNHAEYSRYSQYFLGHAPRNVADKHYVQPSKKQFDNAIRWLGKKLGID